MLAANDSVNGNWNYSYDQFNRLVCANLASNGSCPTSSTPTYSYVYDVTGNRWQQNGPNTFIASFSNANNRMDGYSYDSAGNLLNDGSHSYFYDAENHIVQVDGTLGNCSTATACYVYDAEGRRVHRSGYTFDNCDTDGLRDYIYDLANRPIVEAYNGTACSFQVYAGNRHIAMQSCCTFFYHSDWLGTVRLINNYASPSTPTQTCTSLPFGDGLSCNQYDKYADSTLHFTGQMHDFESGLDYFGARFDASSMGRFMSPDPINLTKRRLVNPGNTLNKYAHAANNPIKYFDPSGKDVTVFYSREGLGHMSLTAFNQETGDVRSLDFNPEIRNKSSDYKTFLGISSTPNFAPPKDPGSMVSDSYASLTIRTTPEEAQQVITWIDQFQKNPQDYNFWANNCTSVCIEALKVLGIGTNHGLLTDDPDDVWDQLFQTSANPNIPVFPVGHYPAEPGTEYGFQRYPGINTYQLSDLYFRLWFYRGQTAPKACVETIDSVSGSDSKSCD